MARGRDATDVALTNSFGAHNLSKFKVWTDEIPEGVVVAATEASRPDPRLRSFEYSRD